MLRAGMKYDFNIKDIKYLKILYTNENNNPVYVKASVKRMDNREITACIKYEENFSIQTPQDITLSIVREEGLYRAQTKLKSYAFNEPYINFYLETPEDFEYRQNREYFRVTADYDCLYHVKNNDQPATFDTKIFDISASGISIILPAPVFSEEDAEIEILTGERIIKTKVQYIRSEKINNDYKLSFQYTEISDNDRDFISKMCIQKQLEDKRNRNI